jgi:hypothetical protein
VVDDTFAKQASDFLLDAAHGKYDGDLKAADAFLTAISPFAPWATPVMTILDIVSKINTATAPLAVMHDGQGGMVPTTNTRIKDDKFVKG